MRAGDEIVIEIPEVGAEQVTARVQIADVDEALGRIVEKNAVDPVARRIA